MLSAEVITNVPWAPPSTELLVQPPVPSSKQRPAAGLSPGLGVLSTSAFSKQRQQQEFLTVTNTYTQINSKYFRKVEIKPVHGNGENVPWWGGGTVPLQLSNQQPPPHQRNTPSAARLVGPGLPPSFQALPRNESGSNSQRKKSIELNAADAVYRGVGYREYQTWHLQLWKAR